MSQHRVLVFWLPLALAWWLMTIESPVIQGVISRKPDSETQLAAFGLLFTLQILIETPIIMLLATSNALSRDRQSFRLLWRFMMGLNLLITLVALLMAFTPLLDLYLGSLLRIPAPIIEATRPGMRIMTVWGAFIGFRRFHQGIIIRFGNTRHVGIGTVLRIGVSGGTALALGAVTNLAGATVGGAALMLAVVAEALYIWRVARPDVARLLATPLRTGQSALTYGKATQFHLPLAITSLLTMLAHPAIERGLASTPDAEQNLAAWPVVFSILLTMRAGGMAYQEVVLSLNESQSHHHVLRHFTLRLGGSLSLFMLVFSFTPLIQLYLTAILGVPAHLHTSIIIGAQIGLLLPLLTTLHSYFRALLMLSHRTSAIYQAIALGFALTTLVVWGGIALGLGGIVAAALGLTLGHLIELLYLYFAYRREHGALQLHWRSVVAAA
ncbi:MAG: hypothetical protein OXE95_03665 [Chloroflexi bacterium]|nr:hypothetical protein [Chloroflexota bacterium]MCY4246658.1 hypothetical protein [Chloroflexota bacterium]